MFQKERINPKLVSRKKYDKRSMEEVRKQYKSGSPKNIINQMEIEKEVNDRKPTTEKLNLVTGKFSWPYVL